MNQRFSLLLATLTLCACATAHELRAPDPMEGADRNLPKNPWSQVRNPSSGPAQVIGFYSRGCIAGADTLPWDGNGYQVMRVSRNRNYGHPELRNFIQELATQSAALGAPLLLGDLSQPRGGPMPYGHTSHQVGLDADIWFWDHPEQRSRTLSVYERNTLPMISMLNANGVVDSKLLTTERISKLKLAAVHPKVERIFVNPAIKVFLCQTLSDEDHSWLSKIRPWRGHDSHFHVRLKCPADSTQCTPQSPPASDDGCQEVIPSKDTKKIPPKSNLHSETEHDDQALDFLFQSSLPEACQNLLKRP